MGIEREDWGRTAQGRRVERFTLRNGNGLVARVMTRGASLTELWVPDRQGQLADVVLGFGELAGYESSDNPYFGCTVGRCANRIAGGRFELDGELVRLTCNEGQNHLHGGLRGFDAAIWVAEVVEGESGAGVCFRHSSPDGDEGYPGSLEVSVTYRLNEENRLMIEYKARTDRATLVNLTHHSYFNLAGHGTEDVGGHRLTVNASHCTPTDESLIPLGHLQEVRGSALDFRSPARLRDRIASLKAGPARGLDHNWVLGAERSSSQAVARLSEERSGRVMEVFTSELGLQVYTGNRLTGQSGKDAASYKRFGGICLEAQGIPDAIHHRAFPSPILRPGELYRQVTHYRFDLL